MSSAKNYALQLGLPVVPDLPPGERYKEFLQLYTSLNQLQDGISDAAGLFSFVDLNAADVPADELYIIRRGAYIVLTAATAITVGQPVQLTTDTPEAKVRQPAAYHSTNGDGIIDTHFNVIGFPYRNCAVGEKAIIGLDGAVVPMSGANVADLFYLNRSFTVSKIAGGGFFTWYYPNVDVIDAQLAFFMSLGYCVVPGKMIVNITGAISYP